MKCFNTVFFASIAASVYTLPGTYPVCIIGAGPAGLAAAASLELKGLKTVIFEKQAHVGGKCQAVYRKSVSGSRGRSTGMLTLSMQWHFQSFGGFDIHLPYLQRDGQNHQCF